MNGPRNTVHPRPTRRKVHQREQHKDRYKRHHRRYKHPLRSQSVVDGRKHKCLIKAAEDAKGSQTKTDGDWFESESSEGDFTGVEEGLEGTNTDVEEGEESIVDDRDHDAGCENFFEGNVLVGRGWRGGLVG